MIFNTTEEFDMNIYMILLIMSTYMGNLTADSFVSAENMAEASQIIDDPAEDVLSSNDRNKAIVSLDRKRVALELLNFQGNRVLHVYAPSGDVIVYMQDDYGKWVELDEKKRTGWFKSLWGLTWKLGALWAVHEWGLNEGRDSSYDQAKNYWLDRLGLHEEITDKEVNSIRQFIRTKYDSKVDYLQ